MMANAADEAQHAAHDPCRVAERAQAHAQARCTQRLDARQVRQYLANRGAGLETIRLALGQATLQMAQNYTHLAAERVREHVANLPALGPIAHAAVTSLDEARMQRVHTRGRSANNGADATAKSSVSPVRFELTTNGLKGRCSTG